MAKSEFDKLVAATNRKADAGHSAAGLTRLMAEVLRLTRPLKKAPPAVQLSRAVTPSKTLKTEVTTPVERATASPVVPMASTTVATAGDDVGRLAAQVDELRRAITPASSPVELKTRAASSAAKSSSGSNEVVKFISTFLGGSGLGSIVSGIAKLFGGGDAETPAPLYQFNLPQSVAVEAGLTRNGQFVPVNYSQNGQARPDVASRTISGMDQQPPQTAPAMTVSSRWFLDHSEDIASAVKDAMLHSHSINDVVADL